MNKKVGIIALIALFIDQISKIIIELLIAYNNSITIIKKFFSITIVHNYGVSWGMLSGKRIIIMILSILTMIFIYHISKSYKDNIRNNIAFGLLIGGMFGNFLDRLILGYVRDFLDFYIFKYNYPVFNIADICIVVGILLLIIATLKGEDESDNKKRKE